MLSAKWTQKKNASSLDIDEIWIHSFSSMKVCAEQQPPLCTMRFGSTAKVLLKCKLKYYRISECGGPTVAALCNQHPSVFFGLPDRIQKKNYLIRPF